MPWHATASQVNLRSEPGKRQPVVPWYATASQVNLRSEPESHIVSEIRYGYTPWRGVVVVTDLFGRFIIKTEPLQGSYILFGSPSPG
ncbi:MAG: hypothetical protein ACI31F_08640 [Muribaculaceae bacterium]